MGASEKKKSLLFLNSRNTEENDRVKSDIRVKGPGVFSEILASSNDKTHTHEVSTISSLTIF